jgi:hypothetical protein
MGEQYRVEVLPPLRDDLFFSYYRSDYDHLFSDEGKVAEGNGGEMQSPPTRCLKAVYIFMGIITAVAVVLLVVMLRK